VLIFSRYPTGTYKYFSVYVINKDSSSLRDLTGDLGSQKFLGLSPDGQKYAFSRDGDIWVAFLVTE
jgi:Tol biopolymer transport system component